MIGGNPGLAVSLSSRGVPGPWPVHGPWVCQDEPLRFHQSLSLWGEVECGKAEAGAGNCADLPVLEGLAWDI